MSERSSSLPTPAILPEDRYDDWTNGPRDEARSHFTGAARRAASAASDDGDHATVTTLVRKLIEADRYDATAHEQLVTAQLQLGEAGQARHSHQLWTRTMAELDVSVPPFGTFSATYSPAPQPPTPRPM